MAKVDIAHDFGVLPESYVRLYEIKADFDADGNGSFKGAEMKAAVDSLGLSREESAVLWQLAMGTKSAKNNPYSPEVGWKVLDAKAKAAKDSEDSGSFADEVNRQVTGK